MSRPELITIVDSQDNVIGSEDRRVAREKGLVHRIAKVIIFNPAGEDYLTAALRETAEEVGITEINLKWIDKYYYERQKNSLTLRRFNGIFTGLTAQIPAFDPAEVAQIKWVMPDALTSWVSNHPTDFTTSLNEILDRFSAQIIASQNKRNTR